MTNHADAPVLTVATARVELSRILKSFREEPGTPPVVLGSHRKPEAVLLPYDRYRELSLASETGTRSTTVLELLRRRRGLITRLAGLSNIRSVSVFGAIARGDDAAAGDIDLLVEPAENGTPVELTQFKADMEQLCGRTVDVVNARSLLRGADDGIRAEAVLLSER